MPDKQYEDLGECSITNADDANIPVDIWLKPEKDDEDKPTGKWILKASNYMPRKGRLSGEEGYKAVASDRQVLVDLVHKHWLPLYQTAVKVLTELKQDERGISYLYYWHDLEA